MYNINTVTLTNNMWHWPLSLMRWPSKRSLQIECYALLWPICSVCQMVTLYSSQSVSMCIQSGLLRDPFIIVSQQPPHKEDIEWAVKTWSRFFMHNKVHVENLNVILTKSTKTGKLLFPAWDLQFLPKRMIQELLTIVDGMIQELFAWVWSYTSNVRALWHLARAV